MKYLTIGDSTYEIAVDSLPIASASTLGGIKVGSGLTIDSTTGVLNATGTSIAIDSAMSNTSTNPVQNKVITETFENLAVDYQTTGITLNTKSIYQMNTTGSVTAGTATTPAQINVQKFSGGSFTRGAFSGGSFTQGTDSFTPASLASGFYTAGTATTPAQINTSKFSGGSFTRGTFSGGSFTQGTDSFTAASLGSGFYTAGTKGTPTVIDTSKFSGGSYSHSGFSGGSFTRGTFTAGSLTMAMDSTDTKKLNITFTAPTHAADSFTAASYGTDSFTAASLGTGFYTAGTATTPASINVQKFSGGSFTQGTDSFTAATHASGFYTAGTKGTPTTIDTSKFSGGSFTQGTDSFTAATHAADSFTAASLQSGFYTAGTKGTPTAVTLPTRQSVTVADGGIEDYGHNHDIIDRRDAPIPQ